MIRKQIFTKIIIIIISVGILLIEYENEEIR